MAIGHSKVSATEPQGVSTYSVQSSKICTDSLVQLRPKDQCLSSTPAQIDCQIASLLASTLPAPAIARKMKVMKSAIIHHWLLLMSGIYSHHAE